MIAAGLGVLLAGMRTGGATAADFSGLSNLWRHGGFFPTGVQGMIASFWVVMFAFGGIEVIGMTAGAARDPQRMIPRAINSVPVRIFAAQGQLQFARQAGADGGIGR
ncbi:hypothetical protein G6F40_015085 [Rhizopus arrhizus]|nr:hypothetical protein G6F40_015085 [Rhizopus arrhizus]